ncbi:MAG: cobyrinate a,c-diamide synthase [Candidatus Melainabacteria bacterium]|nr:cobyrinate a,c-diamide synthase [Candidatus Melainabacteria bacterium]
MKATCPCLLISAPASNQGKTMITAALAYYHRSKGHRVKVFKTGPDFLDPMLLERASGQSVDSLDLWMTGEEQCRTLLFQAARTNDIILVEGVMGLNDGSPSTADLAGKFNLPLAIVVDVSGMAETCKALALGLKQLNPQLNFLGFLANNAGSERHSAIIARALGDDYLGAIERNENLQVERRHLGLYQAGEIDQLESRLAAMTANLEKTVLAKMPPMTSFASNQERPMPKLLAGKHIAVARDNAFSFIYQANLSCLEALGASLSFFSPLKDRACPRADAVYLPGGYPELYLQDLASNTEMKQSLSRHKTSGGLIYAECGGMLYLLDALIDKAGRQENMAGLLHGEARMRNRLKSLGHQYFDTVYGAIRGHTFHYSETTMEEEICASAIKKTDAQEGERLYLDERGRILAGYLHLYFPSNPRVAAAIFSGQARSVFVKPKC